MSRSSDFLPKKRIVATVVGARPQFVKAALVSLTLARSTVVEEALVHTGQHFDRNMDSIFFEEMGLPRPYVNLGVSGGGHGAMTGAMMIHLERVLLELNPSLVLVYGDTNSTLAASLVAAKLGIPVAHVEGGLRNHDFTIPEEINRIVADRLSKLIFCSTPLAVENLYAEGYANFDCKVILTGDLMYDAAIHFLPVAEQSRVTSLDDTWLESPFVLCTIHRPHNTTPPGLDEVFAALNELALTNRIIFPMHPRTRSALVEAGIELSPNIKPLQPVGYLDMLSLLKACECVITDSGGLQKEAYALGKRSLLLIGYTPWAELVEHQYSVTCDVTRRTEILAAWGSLSKLNPSGVRLYGDGNSAQMIVEELERFCDPSANRISPSRTSAERNRVKDGGLGD